MSAPDLRGLAEELGRVALDSYLAAFTAKSRPSKTGFAKAFEPRLRSFLEEREGSPRTGNLHMCGCRPPAENGRFPSLCPTHGKPKVSDAWAELERLRQALTAALAEAAGLRGQLQAMVSLIRDITERPIPPGPKKVFKILLPAESALASPSPLSRAATEVLEAAERHIAWRRRAEDEALSYEEWNGGVNGSLDDLEEALDRYLALLRGEGEESCPCGLPGGQHKLQCPRREDRQAVVTAREDDPDEA